MWDNYKRYIGIPEGEKSEKEAEEIFEVTMAANFTKLMTDTTDRESWEHQAQYIYIYMKSTPRYIIFKL